MSYRSSVLAHPLGRNFVRRLAGFLAQFKLNARAFERANLDAGRLSWLFGREVKPYTEPFDPESYEAMLILDLSLIQSTFPETCGAEQKGQTNV